MAKHKKQFDDNMAIIKEERRKQERYLDICNVLIYWFLIPMTILSIVALLLGL